MRIPTYADNIADELAMGKSSSHMSYEVFVRELAALPNAEDLNGMVLSKPRIIGQMISSLPCFLTNNTINFLLENHLYRQLFHLFEYRVNPSWKEEYTAIKEAVKKLSPINEADSIVLARRMKFLKEISSEL